MDAGAWMLSILIVPALAARLFTAMPAPPGPCEVLPAVEVAKLLAVPTVQLDSVNTGTNELTGVELCSWYVDSRDPRGVTVKLRRAESADETEALLAGAQIDEQVTLERMEAVRGLGDDAHYADWADGSGGTLIARRGSVVLTITGTLKRADAVTAARQALGRL
jgi:hypothetical protein